MTSLMRLAPFRTFRVFRPGSPDAPFPMGVPIAFHSCKGVIAADGDGDYEKVQQER